MAQVQRVFSVKDNFRQHLADIDVRTSGDVWQDFTPATFALFQCDPDELAAANDRESSSWASRQFKRWLGPLPGGHKAFIASLVVMSGVAVVQSNLMNEARHVAAPAITVGANGHDKKDFSYSPEGKGFRRAREREKEIKLDEDMFWKLDGDGVRLKPLKARDRATGQFKPFTRASAKLAPKPANA